MRDYGGISANQIGAQGARGCGCAVILKRQRPSPKWPYLGPNGRGEGQPERGSGDPPVMSSMGMWARSARVRGLEEVVAGTEGSLLCGPLLCSLGDEVDTSTACARIRVLLACPP